MRLLILNTQSISDVVTNSSSEVFILNTNKTCEEVNNILQSFTTGFIFPEVFHLEEYRKWRESTKDEEEYYHYPYTLYEFIRGWFTDPGIDEDMISKWRDFLFSPFRYEYLGNLKIESFGYDDYHPINVDFWKYLSKFTKEIKEIVPKYEPYPTYKDFYNDKYNLRYKLPDYIIKNFMDSYKDKIPKELEIPDRENVVNLDGKILVLSENDNTIPYDTWDQICKLFNGYNIHLG